jgi:F-type H+-transporting ATPase subunit epsilon
MTFKVLTQMGTSYEDEVDYVVIRNKEGEMAIMKDHIPMVVHIGKGHIKLVSAEYVNYFVLEQSVVEFKDDKLTVMALQGQIGKTLERAKEAFERAKSERLERVKQENVDFSKQERELKENIRKSRAGQV